MSDTKKNPWHFFVSAEAPEIAYAIQESSRTYREHFRFLDSMYLNFPDSSTTRRAKTLLYYVFIL